MAELLALDFGTRHIGAARASTEARLPEPIDDIDVNGHEFEVIRVYVETHQVQTIIVGLPRNSKGQETSESLRVKLLVEKLQKHLFNLDVEIVFQGESATSVTADEIMNDSELPYGADSRDSVAAAVIMKDYLSKNEN